MIEATSNGCLYKIIFISITSLEYSFVDVEDGAVLNFVKRNISVNSFFNNPKNDKYVLKVCSLRSVHSSLKARDPNGVSFTLLEKHDSSSGTSKIGILLSISRLVNGNTLPLTIVCVCWSPLPVLDVHRILGLFRYMPTGAHVLCSLPNPLVP